MSRDKQIEEIKALNLLLEDITVDMVLFNSDGEAIDVTTVPAVDGRVTNRLANILYAKGYRKASDIFEEIEKLMNEVYSSVQYGCYSYGMTKQIDSPSAQRQCGKLEGVKYLGDRIAELKKKYTESEKDNG